MEVRAVGSAKPLWRLRVARSWLARLRGLIGHPGLAPGEGLYLPGTNGVHMFFMRFPIDVVFVGPAGNDDARPVLALKSNLAPWTGIVWWVRGASGAIEVPAGSLAASGLRVGDHVTLTPVA
jgi:uncharacterized membrane protein (UPF0127 family)